MMKRVFVYRGRTNKLQISLGFDVSADVITSEIRDQPNSNSDLLATWNVTFITDGTDGEILLTLPQGALTNVTKTMGYMDLKRTSGGEFLTVFDEPFEVVIRDSITA